MRQRNRPIRRLSVCSIYEATGRAGQGGQARVKAPVESDISGFAMGLADQGCLQALFDKTLFDVLHGAGSDAQSGRHIGHFPRITMITRIAQEQGAGVEKLRCRGLAAAGQFGAFGLREGDFVSFGHAGEDADGA